jgi:chloramphenicol-sensitive protein RarD
VDDLAQRRAGVFYGAVAYLWWGLVPLYFLQIFEVPAGEILAHRICWSVLIMLLLTAVTQSWADLGRVFASRKLVLTLLLSATLLAVNWLLYIHATVTGRVSEASLGYYLMPLVNAAFGVVFLGEKLRPAHYPALALIAIAVVIPIVVSGELGGVWLVVVLPVTFGFYGLVRKQVAVDSMTGLTVESLLLLGPSATYLAWLAARGVGKFGPDSRLNWWLAFSGIVTVVPLLTYTLSIRRLPLIAMSFLQFLSPSVQFLLAVTVLGESKPPEMWVASAIIWLSVVIFLADAAVQVWKARQTAIRTTSVCNAPPVTCTVPALSTSTLTSLRTPNSGR